MGVVSWTRDPRGCREESLSSLRTSTPGKKALQEERRSWWGQEWRRPVVSVYLWNNSVWCASSPVTLFMQQMAISYKKAVVVDNLMLCCFAKLKDMFDISIRSLLDLCSIQKHLQSSRVWYTSQLNTLNEGVRNFSMCFKCYCFCSNAL